MEGETACGSDSKEDWLGYFDVVSFMYCCSCGFFGTLLGFVAGCCLTL